MGRPKRPWVSQDVGSFHIISHLTGNDTRLDDDEKEYFLKLMEQFASGFFVHIHAFAIMETHFHILATGLELEAKKATPEELKERYRQMYGKNAEPPEGEYAGNGTLIPDKDGGTERLRERLGNISRFVQELKQSFTRWYNKKHHRKGCLWRERYTGVIVSKGDAQLACSTYIDLNPVRAGIVKRPEDYRWCSLGLLARKPERSRRLIKLVTVPDGENSLQWYREFVYISGGIEKEGAARIPDELIKDVVRYHGKLGIGDCLRYRVRNICEGLAMGTHSFISDVQERYNRKFIRPRPFLKGKIFYSTRVLRL